MMSGGLGMVCWFVGVLLLYGYVVGMKNGHWVVLFFRKGWLIEEDRACPVPTHYTVKYPRFIRPLWVKE